MDQKQVAAFLKLLQSEMKNQEVDGQASPRFWAIGDYKWFPTIQENATRTVIYTTSDCQCEDIDSFVERMVHEDLTEDQIEELNNIHEFESNEKLIEWIRENVEENATLYYEEEKHVVKEDTFFLTKREAKQHIKRNRHHYTSRVHTYAMTAWRSPQVETLYKILETFDWSVLDG